MKFTEQICVVFCLVPFIGTGLTGCTNKEKPTIAPPVRVTVMAVDDQKTARGQIFSGTVESSATTTVSFSVAGTITDLYVNEGQPISKGQIIGKVKSGDYVNADNIAKAELAEARDAYERLKKLHDADALPEIKWVEIQNKLKQAENAAEISGRTLQDATLRSPVSGVVSRKLAEVGQSVVPVEPILEIVGLDELTMNVSIPEQEIGQFTVGQKAKIKIESLGIDSLEGKISQKSIVANPLTRSYTVKITLPKTDKRILPGMVGDVTFTAEGETAESSGEILLPTQAVLLSSDNRNFVWVVKGGKAERRFVTADELVSTGVAVKKGLEAGDSVIVEGMQKVGTGTPVDAISK